VRTNVMSTDVFATEAQAAASLTGRLRNECGKGVDGRRAGPVQCRTMPTVTFANGTRAPSSECQVRYTCPAYQAPCPAKGGSGKPARARGA
jgi:hypothetical protein